MPFARSHAHPLCLTLYFSPTPTNTQTLLACVHAPALQCGQLRAAMSLGAGVDHIMAPGQVPSHVPILRIVSCSATHSRSHRSKHMPISFYCAMAVDTVLAPFGRVVAGGAKEQCGRSGTPAVPASSRAATSYLPPFYAHTTVPTAPPPSWFRPRCGLAG